MVHKSEIGARLKEVREALGMTQTAFGDLGGAGKTTVIAWERGTAVPNAQFLAAIAERGADVLYVITGIRTSQTSPLSPRDSALLDNFHALAEDDRRAIERLTLLAAQCPDEIQSKSVKKAAK